MVGHMNFFAWIQVDGYPLQEFDTKIEGNTATCFIPSQAGRKFEVHWKDVGTGMFTSSYILIDGIVVPGRFLEGGMQTSRSGARSSHDTERPFVFAEIRNLGDQPNTNPAAGTIELKIMQTERDGGRSNNNGTLLFSEIKKTPFMAVSAHRATFGNEDIPCLPQHSTTYSGKPIGDGPRRSYVKFIFKYRPLQTIRETRDSDTPPTMPSVSSASYPQIGIARLGVPLPGKEKTLDVGSPSSGVFQSNPEMVHKPRKPRKSRAPNGKGMRHPSNRKPKEPTEKPVSEMDTTRNLTLPERELTMGNLVSKYKPEFLDGYTPPEDGEFGYLPDGVQHEASSLPVAFQSQAYINQMQHHPHTSNTYIYPNAAGPSYTSHAGPSHAYATNDRGNLGYSSIPHPSTLIDTRIFGHETPVFASSSASGSGSHLQNGQTDNRAAYASRRLT